MRRILIALLFGVFAMGCQASRSSLEETKKFFRDDAVAHLAYAACNGKTEEVAQWLAKGVPVDTQGKDNVTPLMWAVLCQSEEGVEALLKSGADPNHPQVNGNTVTWLAAGLPSTKILAAVLARGGDPNYFAPSTYSVLMHAHEEDAVENYNYLLAHGADINKAGPFGDTIATYAASSGEDAKVLDLLDHGYHYDPLGLAWIIEYRVVSDGALPMREKIKRRLITMGAEWPIPKTLGKEDRLMYLQQHLGYAASHPESAPKPTAPIKN